MRLVRARVERSLNGLAGVEATVNLATDQAAVRFDPSVVSVADLVGTVEAAGYGASGVGVRCRRATSRARCWLRLVVAAVLTVPVALIAMVMPLQFTGWVWVAFAPLDACRLWAAGRSIAPPSGRHATAPRRWTR